MQFNPRVQFFQNVVSLPTSATTSSVTYTSSAFKVSQSIGVSTAPSSGSVEVFPGTSTVLCPGNSYKVEAIVHLTSGAGWTAGTGTVSVQGSWDGSTWFTLVGDAAGTLKTGTTGIQAAKIEFFPAHATFYQVIVVLSGATWTSAAVPVVDLVIQDDIFQGSRSVFYGTAVSAAAITGYSQGSSLTNYQVTLAPGGNSTMTAYNAGAMTGYALGNTWPYGPNTDAIQMAYISTFVVGTPIGTLAASLVAQGSMDGINWYSLGTLNALTLPTAGNTALHNQIVSNDNMFAAVSGTSGALLAHIGNFIRIGYTTPATSTITTSGVNYIYTAVTAVY